MTIRATRLAHRTLDGFVASLLPLGGGVVVLERWMPGRTTSWLGLDRALAPRWDHAWSGLARDALLADGDRAWFGDGARVRALDGAGRLVDVATVAALGGVDGDTRVLAALDDGFVLARGCTVVQVDRAGRARWPAPRVLASRPEAACVSGDRVAITTASLQYTHWGNLGPIVMLRLGDGAPIAELRGERVHALPGARFVAGLEGYDVFDSWLYDGNGELLQRWRSDGHHVVDPDGTIRVLERNRQERGSSALVRLHPDGTIERGARLISSAVSAPVRLGDGTLLFVDGGVLVAAGPALRVTLLAELAAIDDGDDWRYQAFLALDPGGDTLHVALRERLAVQPVRGPGATAADTVYACHLWSFALREG